MNFSIISKISSQERLKFFLTSLLFFLITLTYNLLRSMKITFVVGAPQSGAEIIPFLKVWGILPAALIFSHGLIWLAEKYSSRTVFTICVSIFFLFYASFLFILYPHRETLELKNTYNFLSHLLPQGLGGLWLMIRYWYLSLFYIFSELWGSIVLVTLFWGFVNESNSMEEAKKHYGVFVFSGNLAPILSGQIGIFLQKDKSWDEALWTTLMAILGIMAFVVLVFRFLEKNSKKKNQNFVEEKIEKTSLIQCFKEVQKDPYLKYLAWIVFGYNFVFNLTDILFTYELKRFFGEATSQINIFMNHVISASGLTSSLLSLFVTTSVIRRFGWKIAALVTPIVVWITSAVFLPVVLWPESLGTYLSTPLPWLPIVSLAVLLGSLQNIGIRGCKYTLFDATKEMAYTPLNPKTQRRGKVIIDSLGSRLGKSGGSVFYQFLLLLCSSFVATLPFVAFMITLVSLSWFRSILKLDAMMLASKDSEKNFQPELKS